MPLQATDPGSGFTTKRHQKEGIFETQAGAGNGITGHDETSEDISNTWDTTYTTPTPGTPSAALFDDFLNCSAVPVEKSTWSSMKKFYRE